MNLGNATILIYICPIVESAEEYEYFMILVALFMKNNGIVGMVFSIAGTDQPKISSRDSLAAYKFTVVK